MTVADVKARRRRPGEVRALLLEAARDVFAQKGYGGASTREIAEAADVSEALLFRHFKSKANLFDEAVMLPFTEFVDDFMTRWEAQRAQPWSDEQLMTEFVTQLYERMTENRRLVLALIAASAHEVDALKNDQFEIGLSGMLDRLVEIGETEAGPRGFHVDYAIAVRAVAGMVVSMAVLGPWMFEGRKRPPTERIVAEMVAVALHGVARRD